MRFNFDKEFDRRGTHSVKWEYVHAGDGLRKPDDPDENAGLDRLLPMWVADMDFRCPEPVIEALKARVEHGIFGYSIADNAFYQSVVGWMERRQGWIVDPGWISLTPGVVPALNMLVRTFTQPGDQVLIQPPVYYPFMSAVENNAAELVYNPLVLEDGRYHMDFADLKEKCQDPRVKLAILCSPHNPVGRVWTRDELLEFGRICLENDVLVVSDEIHADLILTGHAFTPFAGISEAFAQGSVICTAPSKTFNIAGLQTSCIMVPNQDLRTRFQQTLQSNGLHGVNALGLVALQAAYEGGEAWLDAALDYIEGNLIYLEQTIADTIPQIDVIRPEGTYLAWLDCRRLGLDGQELRQLFFDQARVYMDDGFIFGEQGEGFERINLACPRSLLEEALDRIREAIARSQEHRAVPGDIS